MRASAQHKDPAIALLLAAYIALIAYGSFFPFEWRTPAAAALRLPAWPSHVDKSDVIQNLFVYFPLGLLVAMSRNRARAVFHAALVGGMVSLSVEMMQYWLPARVPSMLDVVADVTGAACGGMCAALWHGETHIGERLRHLRSQWIVPGTPANMGLCVILFWAVAQTAPLLPSLDIAQLRGDLAQLLHAMQAPERTDVVKILMLLCYQTGLSFLLCTLLRRPDKAVSAYSLLLLIVFGVRLLVAERFVTLELVLAALGSLAALALWCEGPASRLAACGAVLIAAGLAIAELAPAPSSGVPAAFNWVPFSAQIARADGFENLIACIWPGMALAYCMRLAAPPQHRRVCALVGGMLLLATMLALEWLQQRIPGRHGDITQVAMVCAGWALVWMVRSRSRLPPSAPPVGL
jgi:VanZ family protein